MLDKLEVRTDRNELLSLPFGDVSNGYSIQDITGLDPVPANIVSSSFARMDGEQYQSSRREKRNPVVKIGLEADYSGKTVQELRNDLYRWFTPPMNTNLRFFTDNNPLVDISGIVESFSCPLFVKDTVATISVLCLDPDFYEPVSVTISGSTTDSTTMGTINYEGTVDSGILFTLNIDRPLTGFTIYHQPTGDTVRSLVISGDFVSGDVVTISTIPGSKYVRRKRGSTTTSILYAISPYSDWTRLQPGSNRLRVYAEGDAIPYTIRYTNKHGGL